METPGKPRKTSAPIRLGLSVHMACVQKPTAPDPGLESLTQGANLGAATLATQPARRPVVRIEVDGALRGLALPQRRGGCGEHDDEGSKVLKGDYPL